MEWFRFYTGTTTDSKIRKITQMTGMNIAEVVGLWAIILCYANDSPKRGALLIAEGVPVTDGDLAGASGCTNVTETLQILQQLDMLDCSDGIYSITNWNRCNDGEALQKHCSNAPETEVSAGEKSPSNNKEKPPKPKSDPRVREMVIQFQKILGYPVPNFGAEAKAAKWLVDHEHTPETVFACWRHLQGDKFWEGKHCGLQSVKKQIGSWIKAGKAQGNGTNCERVIITDTSPIAWGR